MQKPRSKYEDSMPIFAIEKYADVIDEAAPLIEKHYDELASYKDISLRLRHKLYQIAEILGEFVLFTVRDGQTLVGYAPFFLREPMHYEGCLWAFGDVFWVHPEWRKRGLGRQLVQFCEAGLSKRGVTVVNLGEKIAHPALGMLLKSEGYDPKEVHYQKRLR
jgi:GNAT superfamily N-acetyltransferase